MRFRLIADASFDAENIDHAFEELARHFFALANGEDSDVFVPPSDIRVVPAYQRRPTGDDK